MLKLKYGNKTILNSSRTGYVGFIPPEPPANPYHYTSKLNSVVNGYDVPTYTDLNSAWARPAYTTGSCTISGSCPSTYSGFNTLTFSRNTSESGLIDISGKDEFTVSFWCKANGSISGACQFCACRLHQSNAGWQVHYDRPFLADINNATITMLNGTTREGSYRNWFLGGSGYAIKTTWHYCQIYVNRTTKVIEWYIDGTCYLTFTNVPDTILTTNPSGYNKPGIDLYWMYRPDSSSYGNQMIMDFVIFRGKHIGVPSSPLS